MATAVTGLPRLRLCICLRNHALVGDADVMRSTAMLRYLPSS